MVFFRSAVLSITGSDDISGNTELKSVMFQADREERDAKERHLRNKEQLAMLQTQMAALEKRKAEEKRLIAEQAELLVCHILYTLHSSPTVSC